jgi:hypothetical protein
MDPGQDSPRSKASKPASTEPDLFSAPFDNGVHARASDPETSHAAAASVNQSEGQALVLKMFRRYGPMTDEVLQARMKEHLPGMLSESGVRTRRSELSKPNMERLEEIVVELTTPGSEPGEPKGHFSETVRAQLRREGFRSVLWDSGERADVSSGRRQAIVWEIAT